MAMAIFWSSFHHDGKFSPAYVVQYKVVVYGPAERADTLPVSTLSLYVLYPVLVPTIPEKFLPPSSSAFVRCLLVPLYRHLCFVFYVKFFSL